MSDEPQEVTITLPYPPTVNHAWGHNRHGGKYLRKSGRTFRLAVATALVGVERFGSARVSVGIELYPPTRAGDIDNRIKPLLDALEQAGLFDNDRQVDYLWVRRSAPEKPGHCVVTVQAH